MFQALAAMLGLEELCLGAQGAEPPVTGLWTVEIESQMQPAIAIGIVHQGARCRAALAVMPDDPFSPLPARCMPGDDVVLAAEKQLRYVPLVGPAGASNAATPSSIHYRVQSWAQDSSASVSFVSPSRGPLRTLATTLHQLADHVAQRTGALDSVRFLARQFPYDEIAAE